MCGILGQINFDSQKVFDFTLKDLQHRGPDGCGEWYNKQENIHLGHTRLAIIDLTKNGEQPMNDASQRFTIVYNGEIYNHRELRKSLPDMEWKGHSDTETLLELYALKGMEAFPLLKGMFAFAVHDSRDNSILLIRDRLGIKPLYVRRSERNLCFASEVRALLTPGENRFTKDSLSQYLGFGHFPSEGEILDKITSLAPGSWMKISATGTVRSGIWWPTKKMVRGEVHKREFYVKRVKHLVTTAIEEHLISDVGIGAFLSGGIDSSILAGVAGKRLGKNLQTFTVGFPQTQYDERMHARKVANQIGSTHFEIEVCERKCQDWVMEAVNKLDLPSVDAINTYIVSKAVRDKGFKVGLSGLGGDELFGGYPSFKNIPLLNWLKYLPGGARSNFIGMMPAKLREKLEGLDDFSTTELALARRRFISLEDLKKLELNSGVPAIPSVPAEFDEMGKISWAEIFGYMVPMLLRDCDQMSMAVGLEIRVPFLDHHLVEEVLAFPQKVKKGNGVKPLLVEAFKDVLPKEVYSRPKQGFALPMAEWMHGPLYHFTRAGINSAAVHLNFSAPLVQLEKFNRNEVHWTRVWHWAVLGHWMKNNGQHSIKSKTSKLVEVDT